MIIDMRGGADTVHTQSEIKFRGGGGGGGGGGKILSGRGSAPLFHLLKLMKRTEVYTCNSVFVVIIPELKIIFLDSWPNGQPL